MSAAFWEVCLVAVVAAGAYAASAALLQRAFCPTRTAAQRMRRAVARLSHAQEEGPRRHQGWGRLPQASTLWVRARRRLEEELLRAGTPLRVREFVLLSGACTVAAVALVLTLDLHPTLKLVLAACASTLPLLWLKRIRHRNRLRVDAQTGDALSTLTNSLRSGASFYDALQLAAQEMPPPMSVELHKTVQEMAFGLRPEEALQRLVARTGSEDLDLAVTAFGITREVGGNLAEVLDNIGGVIRERARLRGEVRALSAQGRLSALLLALMPLLVWAGMSLLRPGYMEVLFADPMGRAMLVVALAAELAGVVVISRLVRIDV